MNCERHINGKQCKATATEFVCGQNVCAVHAVAGDPHCTHSLAPSGRCSYCGEDLR